MARVIRAERSGPSLVPGEVYDAGREAARILNDARCEATRIVAEARSAAETVRASAHERGRAAGYASAARELFDVAKLRQDTLRSAEEQALRAVLLVAAELLGTTLAADPAQIVSMLAPHLARVRRAQHIVLKVHPEDVAWLEQRADALRERAGLVGELDLHADAEIARGGCLIESTLGEVDARVETRLSELARALGLQEDKSP